MWLLLKSPKLIFYLDPKDMKQSTKKPLECHRALFVLSYRLIGPYKQVMSLSDPCWVVIGEHARYLDILWDRPRETFS